MQIHKTTSLDELSKLAGDWNRLSGGVPFRSYEWLVTWWRHYQPAMEAMGREVELYTLCVVDGSELVGIAPWYIDRSRSSGSVVRFLGSGQVCSDYLSVLCEPDRESAVGEAIAQWLADSAEFADSTNRWDLLELTSMDAADGIPELLANTLTPRGAVVHSSPAMNTWRIELPDTLEEYLGRLSKSHRKQLRQLQRRYFESGRAVLKSAQRASDVDTGWRILKHLHQCRLESLGKPGCFDCDTFTRFHREATDLLFRAGNLRLHWLELDGQPVAAEYHLAGTDAIFAYQGGIEPKALDCEPGRLITLATLERAIEDGYRVFDFCRGDEPYKAHWRAEQRRNVTWRIVCNRPSARFRHCIWVVGQSARNWMKGNWTFVSRAP